MKINKVIINNFRNYYGKYTFELNDNITILVGNNGNGKSSFFDAIEWCLTGDIKRFGNTLKEAVANTKMLSRAC